MQVEVELQGKGNSGSEGGREESRMVPAHQVGGFLYLDRAPKWTLTQLNNGCRGEGKQASRAACSPGDQAQVSRVTGAKRKGKGERRRQSAASNVALFIL